MSTEPCCRLNPPNQAKDLTYVAEVGAIPRADVAVPAPTACQSRPCSASRPGRRLVRLDESHRPVGLMNFEATLKSDHRPSLVWSSWFAVWTGSGPGRLHGTIKTGEIISKARATDYTAARFPEFSELLLRIKASRNGDRSSRYSKRDGVARADMIDQICEVASIPSATG